MDQGLGSRLLTLCLSVLCAIPVPYAGAQTTPPDPGTILAIRIWLHEPTQENYACFYGNLPGSHTDFNLLYPKAISQARYTEWRDNVGPSASPAAPQVVPVSQAELNTWGLSFVALPIGLTAFNLALIPAGTQWQVMGFGLSVLVTLAAAGGLAWDLSKGPSPRAPREARSVQDSPLHFMATPEGVVTFFRVPAGTFEHVSQWLQEAGQGSTVGCG